jgi:hypothetical protein
MKFILEPFRLLLRLILTVSFRQKVGPLYHREPKSVKDIFGTQKIAEGRQEVSAGSVMGYSGWTNTENLHRLLHNNNKRIGKIPPRENRNGDCDGKSCDGTANQVF